MEWFKDYSLWIMLSTLATALFTGVAVVIAWKVYQQAQISAGRQRPIVIHSPIEGQPRFIDKEKELEPSKSSKLEIYRVAHVYIFNQSDVPQTLTILDSKIKGPGCKHFYYFSPMIPITIPPHQGGNVPIYFFNDEWLNLSKESLDALVIEWHSFRCLLQIRAQTLSGRKIRFCGLTKLLKPYYSP